MPAIDPDGIRELVVAIDFSDGTETVLAAATRLARASGATVHLVHVAAPEPGFVGYDAPGGPGDRDNRAGELKDRHQALQVLTKAIAEQGVTVKPLLASGATTATIQREAERLSADMIIIGSHGHGAVHRFLVGSTTESLIRQSEIPVLVIPIETGGE